LFCWTNNDQDNTNTTVYAFDADTFAQVWAIPIGLSAVWSTQAPAIDPVTNILYFIYKNNNDNGFNYIIAIDIFTGKQLADSPKLINATVKGTGDASVGGEVAFQSIDGKRTHQNSRVSILVLNSVLYLGFAHNSDSFPYHGWIFSYQYNIQASKFNQLAYFCTTPNDGLGGVWQSGQGIATDGKFIYFTTGNGNFDPNRNSWSMAVLKLSLQLTVVDYFVPANWKGYSNGDQDLGNCGPTIIPNTRFLVVAVTKYGAAHLVDTANMGKFNGQRDACKQTVSVNNGFVAPGGNPVAWDLGGGKGAKIYMWGPNLAVYQYHFDPVKELLDLPGVNWAGDKAGGSLFITSNGENDAILWALGMDGKVYAFDASKDLSVGPIWTYTLPSRSVHWQWPLISNGKVYVPGGNAKTYVFGL